MKTILNSKFKSNLFRSLEMENEVKVDIGPSPSEMVVESEIESFEDLGPG